MKATEVFTPGRFPTWTYVDDHLVEKNKQLKDVLGGGAMLISISGPSKSGKTVFVEQVIGKDNLISITGAGIRSADDLWRRVFDIIGTPINIDVNKGDVISGTLGASGEAQGSALVIKGKAGVSSSASYSNQHGVTERYSFDLLNLLIRELQKTDYVIFIDDFHYIDKDIQQELARQIKEAIRHDIKFICASVPYHSDDIIRGNADLRGRIFSIDFDYWGVEVLRKIAQKGFDKLGVTCDQSMIEYFVSESAGSPQLMQFLCLNACLEVGVNESFFGSTQRNISQDDELKERICKRTVLSTDYSSIVEKMIEGPKTRGSERKLYQTKYGWQGDVYRILIKSLSLNPPQLTYRYNQLSERVSEICVNDVPSGSSITGACSFSTLFANGAAGYKIIEWDGDSDVLDIRDPYLLFYLRWSNIADI